MYLIDTNVLSEARRGDPTAVAWLRGIDPLLAYLSVVTVGEIAKGIEMKRRRDPSAAEALGAWLAGILQRYQRRILPIDQAVMLAWGRLQAERPRPVMDCLIAATAEAHRKIVVTRNDMDFAGIGVGVVNPWR
ncbi:MAG: type II toxin-antitoxin system VapC family toxin [Rhodospirillales bacterium]